MLALCRPFAELEIVGTVDLVHPPGPEWSQDLVEAKACSRRQRHTAVLPGVVIRAGYYNRLSLAAIQLVLPRFVDKMCA